MENNEFVLNKIAVGASKIITGPYKGPVLFVGQTTGQDRNNVFANSILATHAGRFQDIYNNEYTDRTLRWKDETEREKTGHPPSHAEVEKMLSLTHHIYGCRSVQPLDIL